MDSNALIAFVVEIINKVLKLLNISYELDFGAKAPEADEEVVA